MPVLSWHLILLPLPQKAEFQNYYYYFFFFTFFSTKHWGAAYEQLLQYSVWGGGGFRGLSQIYSRSWLHIMMWLLPQRCRTKLQFPSATSFFISKYGSVFDNHASAHLSGSMLQYNRFLLWPTPPWFSWNLTGLYPNMLTKLTGFLLGKKKHVNKICFLSYLELFKNAGCNSS